MLGSQSRRGSCPTCAATGAQLALSFPAVPGGCVENEWKRQLAVLACLLTSPRKNVSDFSLTLWTGREEGLLKLQSLPCPAWEGAAPLLLPALLVWAGICPLLFSAGLCSALGLCCTSERARGCWGPLGTWEILSAGAPVLLGIGECVPSACQPEEGAGSGKGLQKASGISSHPESALNVKGSEMCVSLPLEGPGPPLPS